MFDARLHPTTGRICDRFARPLARRGITATRMTIAGFLIGLASLPVIAAGFFLTGLALILLNRLADGLDGALARHEGPSESGAFLDIALDFFFYASVPLAFALADPVRNGLPAAFLLAGFVGSGSSFLALASLAAKRGLASTKLPGKGIYYLGGLTEGAETIMFFAIICIWPASFPWAAFIFGTLCLATALMRWVWGYRLLT